MASAYKELRIVLLGKTGSGKSSAGNTILGPEDYDNHFKTEASPQSITKTCASQKEKIGDRIISVIDTPGQFNTSMSEQEMKTEMEKCVYMSVPGPHVFLLVIKVGRFTNEEKSAVTWIKENFGEEAARYTIVLFTHADQLKKKPLYEYIRESNDLMALVNECGGRVHSFNNEDTENRDQVTELVKKIEKMVEKNGGQHYNEMYREAQRKIEWEAWKQKARDYGGKALTLVVGGTAVAATTAGAAALGAVKAAGGTGAALALGGQAATTAGAAALGAVTAAAVTAVAAVRGAGPGGPGPGGPGPGGPGTGGPGAGGALAERAATTA